ncbi:MAG: autotransporter domain-containing protein, partial [Phascolarctobacterium sp.]|nr:autotransporter domain-containing protein [Phascolarctobacterium sp.]
TDVKGKYNFEGNANGIYANSGGSVVNVEGGSIKVAAGQSKGYAALIAEDATINMNVVNGEATNNKVEVEGNVVVSTGAVNVNDIHGTKTAINLGLTTADSTLHGAIYNAFPEEGVAKGDLTFKGEANLWLQNGATWNNEVVDALTSIWGGAAYAGSHVTTFKGGASAAAAGNIYQKDANVLTIDNYSGVINIFYAHNGDGSVAENYTAGDTIIKHAEAGSVVNLITNGDGSAAADINVVANILSTLAGKLTYASYVEGERNLTGTVKLAGGLTTDSVTWAVKDIVFDAKSGQGGINKDAPIEFPEAPEEQEATDFNSGLNGSTNLEYVYGGVQQDDGSYKFTENTNITVNGGNAVSDNNNINVDASGKTLTLVASNSNDSVMGIAQANGNAIDIKADKLVVNVEASTGYSNAKGIASLQNTLEQKAVTNVDATTEITAKGAYGAIGVYAGGNAELNLKGNTTIEITGNVSDASYGYYSTSGIYAASSYAIQTGATINANGNVAVKGDGVGIFANGGGSTVNVNGSVSIDATKDYMPAIVAQSGTVNINAEGNTSNTVNIKGNIVAGAGSVYGSEPCKESVVNLNMSNSESVWHGVAYNQFPEDGIDVGASTFSLRAVRVASNEAFTGAINVNLSNGAQWINEAQGALPNAYTSGGGIAFNGSRVAQLNGGTGSSVGYIYQKDANPLTIDNLSGNVNITYDHTINEATQAIEFAAGNTVIGSAEAGSKVTMATAANGINTSDKAAVEEAFQGLAQKLIYNDAAANPTNLAADLTIGGGLTGDTASWKGNIEFDGVKGGYKAGSAEQAINLLYDEDVVSKDTRAAIMSSMVTWRNAAADTYSYRHSVRAPQGGGRGPVDSGTRLGANDEGVWARTWGGQNKYSGNNTSFKSSFWAGQVGYDKNLANGWNVGVAFDYMTGDDSYNNGSGDSKTYTLGFYGSKEVAKNEFVDVTAKIGHFSNDFETTDILGRTVKGDYNATGFSISGQYSKRFGSEAAGYFEPSAQLTIGRMGSSDFDSTGTLEGHISQDAFTSIVGTLGLEAGQASEHGRYFARLSLNHEFAGSMDTHFSDAYNSKTREFDLDGTWCDLTMGGTYEINDNLTFYGDVTKTLNGDYKHDWMINAGLRFTF